MECFDLILAISHKADCRARLLMLPFGWNENALIVIGIAPALSAIPDIDLKWMRHSVTLRDKEYLLDCSR